MLPPLKPQDQWKQQQVDAIADALHELLSSPENGVEDVVDAVESAIDSWLNYYEVEREKWLQLKAALRHLNIALVCLMG
jgi:hypothetical protein